MAHITKLDSAKAIMRIADTVGDARPHEAPFVLVVGAGFSAGRIPMVGEIVRDHLPAWNCAMKGAPGVHFEDRLARYLAHLKKPEESRRVYRNQFWHDFYIENKNELARLYPPLWSDMRKLGHEPPDVSASAYQAAFDTRLYGPLSSPSRAREFQRAMMRPESIRLNEAHFYLARLLGDLSDTYEGTGRYQEGVALSRVILTTNFDSLLSTALLCLSVPYRTIDDFEHEIDSHELEDASYLVHLAYVHGSIHRRSQAIEDDEIKEIKERNARSLQDLLSPRGAIVIGHSGWDDVIVEALRTCPRLSYPVYWCGLEDDPLAARAFGPSVRQILEQGRAHYVQIESADSFMQGLWKELAGPRNDADKDKEIRPRPVLQWIQQRLREKLPESIVEAEALARASELVPPAPPTVTASPSSVPPVSPASQVASGSPTDILRVSTEAALSAAIKAASARARILLHPGTYRLPLLIDKELVIEGDGKDRTAVRIEVAEGSALEFRAERGRVANLSLCQTRGGLEAAVAIRKGELTLENCCIESNGVGISVWGPDTKPNLCGNRVWRCEEGVVFSENAEGALEGGEVCLNRRSGVIIREGARPSIRRVSVYGNGHVGILIQSASGTIERNPIFENGREGIMVHGDGASPTITGNSIAHNVKAGIYLCDQVTGEVTENTVELNQNSGIAIRQHGNPSITRNVVRSNNGKGVWAADQAAGTVKDNDLRGNYYGDWWKSKDSSTCFEGGNDRVPDQ